jgi:hypothetical protein
MKKQIANVQDLLRSINIIYDADEPDRIAHFQPTSKSLALIRSVLAFEDERAFFISAPYGTGKSIAHTYILQVVENSSKAKPTLDRLAQKVNQLDQNVGQWLDKRCKSDSNGIVLVLQGYQEDLPKAIGEALFQSIKRIGNEPFELFFEEAMNFDTLTRTLNSIKRLIDDRERYNIDRIVFIWDEFGRHLESLIAEGRTAELNNLQSLAEFASRVREVPVSLSLLLHQSLMNYAGKVPQTIRREWRKIEGRFETIQYIDDSKEIYNLLSNVAQQREDKRDISPMLLDLYEKEFEKVPIFRDFSEVEYKRLIQNAYPIEPVTLYMLPRVSSRIAQHERTLFTFLNSYSSDDRIGLSELYDYFSISMSSDTSIGGTYHQWLEAESAISKLDNEMDIAIIKAACLLGIGITGARQRISLELLEYALLYTEQGIASIREQIQALIDKKLLLYRKNTNSVSIWHGTDLDIKGKLEEEKARLSMDFDPIEFLRGLIEPLHWKGVEHNNRYKITRYLKGEYIDLSRLRSLLYEGVEASLESSKGNTTVFEDGRIFYIIPQSEAELEESIKEISSDTQAHPQVLFVVPRKHVEIAEMALEVHAYHSLQDNPQLIEQDPLILPELQQLADDSMDYLQRIVMLATSPSAKGPRFFYQGGEIEITSPVALRKKASEIFTKVFSSTPILNNEMINRRFPRTNLVNARKKLILSILEQAGQPNLLLEGFTPNVSFFRALLKNTGLYRPVDPANEDGSWHFVDPGLLNENSGLQRVWEELRNFFTEPGEKSIEKLLATLKRPPFGMRDGVLPILFTAAYRAFPSALTIMDHRGEYLPDILATDIELMMQKPGDYTVSVPELNVDRIAYLQTFIQIFDEQNVVSVYENDLLRRAYDTLELWKTRLPKAALQSRRLSNVTRDFQNAVRRPGDPSFLLFKSIPGKLLYDHSSFNLDVLTKRISECKAELESVSDAYYITASQSVLNAIQLSSEEENPVIVATRLWLGYFDLEVIEKIKDGTSRAFLSRIQNPYQSDQALINSLSSLLRGKDIEDWDDSDVIGFDKEVQDVVHRIEEFMMNKTDSHDLGSDIKHNLARLAVNRMSNLKQKIESLVGKEQAENLIKSLM